MARRGLCNEGEGFTAYSTFSLLSRCGPTCERWPGAHVKIYNDFVYFNVCLVAKLLIFI